jgi:hypothetical protein
MRSKAVIEKFEVIYQHVLGRSKQNHGNMNEDSLSPDWDFNLESAEYAAGVITT